MARALLLMVGLAACSSTAPTAKPPALVVTRHGAPVPAGDATPIATVLAAPDGYAGKPMLVTGQVRSACTRKGCWMEVAASADKGTPGCRVTFKDYGFFVPTDAAGAQARVHGVPAVRVIDKDEVAHLESEGAKFAKGPDGSARELRIEATGVELQRPAKM